jgi:hypothetical protein
LCSSLFIYIYIYNGVLIIAPVLPRFVGTCNRSVSRLPYLLWSWCRRPGNWSVWKIITIYRPWRRLCIIRPRNRPIRKIAINRRHRSCYWPARRIISIAGIWIDRFNNWPVRLIISVCRVGIYRPCNRSCRKSISVTWVQWPRNRPISIVSVTRVWIARPCNKSIVVAVPVSITGPVERTLRSVYNGTVIIVAIKLRQWSVHSGRFWMISPE